MKRTTGVGVRASPLLELARRLAREPLLLFCAVGAALFALAPRDRDADEVHLSARSLRSLESAEARRRGRAELPADEAASVRARAVDDELLYREGLRLGVDKNDNIVRQRVIEKMLFLAEDLAGSARPVGDGELQAFLKEHAASFPRAAVASFVHVFAERDPAALEKLRHSLPADALDPPPVGDAFPLGRKVIDIAVESVRAEYGPDFATLVASAPVGDWVGPVRSHYGYHLLRIVSRRGGGPASLDEVRGPVRIAYVQQRREQALGELMRGIRARYRVTIDDRDGAQPAGSASASVAAQDQAARQAREAD
jgi:hypothetical protein